MLISLSRKIIFSGSLAAWAVVASAGALGLAAASGPALAQTAAAKAAVDAAKASGLVGEQADGFLGFVGAGSDPAVAAAMTEINAGRAQAYREAAARTGVSPEAAGQATAQQLLARLPEGQYFRNAQGTWTRK